IGRPLPTEQDGTRRPARPLQGTAVLLGASPAAGPRSRIRVCSASHEAPERAGARPSDGGRSRGGVFLYAAQVPTRRTSERPSTPAAARLFRATSLAQAAADAI